MTTELELAAPDLAVVDYRAKAAAIRTEAAALVVASVETRAIAVDFLGRIARLKKESEAERVGLVKKPNDYVRDVNAAFAEALKPVVLADQDLRRKMLDYDTAERRPGGGAGGRGGPAHPPTSRV